MPFTVNKARLTALTLLVGLPLFASHTTGAQTPKTTEAPKTATQKAATAKTPNFLIIIADDLTWRDVGFVGNKDVHTPNLDHLREQGMHLRGMYTPATVCSPCRHALYTGMFPVRTGAYPNHTHAYDGTKSLFTYFKDHGYRVALQNKEHVGPPASFPYEHIAGADDFTPTRQFIERNADQPWLLTFASNDPHSPWTRGPKDLYKPAKLTIPPYLHDNMRTRRQRANYYAEVTRLDEQVGSLMKLLDDTGQAENTVVLFVSEQGSSFPYGGKWMLYDNGMRTTALLRWPGKVKAGSTSDALMEYVDVAPTFLAAAGIDPGGIDTGCPDAQGKHGFDGKSFLDILQGKSDHLRDYVFSEQTTVGIIGYREPYPMRAVRDTRYKLIRNLAPQNTFFIGGIHKTPLLATWQEDAKTDPALAARINWLYKRPASELYDLQTDPYEEHNLADDPAQAGVKTRLEKELDAWMAQQGDKGMETELKAKSRQGPGGGDD